MLNWRQPRLCLLALGLGSAATVVLALVAQHHFGMEPCPWCILQRMQIIGISVLALLAAAIPSKWVRVGLSGLIVPLAISGMAAALWQHFVAAKTNSCALTLADRIISGMGLDTRFPEVFEVRASCADAAVSIIGIPFEFWSLAWFVISALVAVIAIGLSVRRA
ncbi:MAG: disulfide bond formation protein B [Aquabacterium sp.]